MARDLVLLITGLIANLCFAAQAMAGDELPDPTRPPAALIKSSATSANGAGADASGGSALQSVILRKGHKPVAIIAGERVELGGVYGGARLINVTESRVVLDGPSGRETLLLTPAVEKKFVIETKKSAKGKTPGGAVNKK
jgi:MSHA biogenesis protein MshK